MKGSLHRVSRREPCPICGHSDWCRVGNDGRFAVCNRVDNGHPARGSGGGWLHRLDSGPRPAYRPPPPPDTLEACRATSNEIHRTYDEVLRLMVLTPVHREQLRARGMDDREIAYRRYRSLAGDRVALCKALRLAGHVIEGVPGFYREAGRFGDYWTLWGYDGLMVPILDTQRVISGVQIRPDNPERGRKYVWLSSPDRPGGCSSGAPIHVARPLGETRDFRIWITEGPLKGDIAAERLGAVVVAMPGVQQWTSALAVAETLAVRRHGIGLVLALDADAATNPAVHAARQALGTEALTRGHVLHIAQWPSGFKGIDDALAARARVTTARAGDVLDTWDTMEEPW